MSQSVDPVALHDFTAELTAPSRKDRRGVARDEGRDITQTQDVQEPLRAEHRAEVAALRATLQQECREQLDHQQSEFEETIRELKQKHSEEKATMAALQESFLSGIAESVSELYSASESELVELACEIAESILERNLTDEDRQLAADSLAWAMEQLAGDGHLDIHLSEQFANDLESHSLLPNIEVPSLVRWHRGPLADGDFVVASPTSSIRRIRAEAILRAKAEIRGGSTDE